MGKIANIGYYWCQSTLNDLRISFGRNLRENLKRVNLIILDIIAETII
jgi:hypothetical protein